MGPPEAINENLFGALTAGGDNASARTPMNLVSIGRAPGHTTRPSQCFHGKSGPRNGSRVTDVTGVGHGGDGPGVSTGRHGYRYPAWQFDESGVLPGLEDVLKVLATHDEWMQVAFFVSKNQRLANRTPVETLKAGKVDLVLDAAEVYGEHGAE